MCKLCDKIYRVSESSPYLTQHIRLDPEGVFQLMAPWYDITSDTDGWLSTNINFCPECGSPVNYRGFRTLNESRQKRNYDRFSTPVGERKVGTI